MSLVILSGARAILRVSAVYFLVCGVSAIWLPASWLWFSGLPTGLSNELTLTFGVIGAYMLAMAAGACVASTDPVKHAGITLTLAIANALDFLVTLRAVLLGWLPALNGTAFLVVAVIWTTLLCLACRAKSS
jgi:hypothetical protein